MCKDLSLPQTFSLSSATVQYGGVLTCYYEYFSQELLYISYEIDELNITNTVQTQGNSIVRFLQRNFPI